MTEKIKPAHTIQQAEEIAQTEAIKPMAKIEQSESVKPGKFVKPRIIAEELRQKLAERRNLRRGFHASQLIEYSLDPNPNAEEDKQAPPQKLLMAFSTADINILGWRLERLAKLLQENRPASVSTLPKRYAELEPQKSFVSSIEIKPVGKE